MNHKTTINKIYKILTDANVTPQEARYIFKQVRNKGKWAVPKVSKKLPDYLNPSEYWYLLELVQNDQLTGIIIESLVNTGLRVSEFTNLLVQNIDFYQNQIKVVQGKGSKDRYVPITTNLKSKWKLWLNNRSTGYLVQKKNNKPYTKRAIQQRITNALKKLNISGKKLSTHSLRHTYACFCLSKGMRLEDIKLLLGHSNIKTTEIYAKLELGDIKDKFIQLMDRR